MRVLITGGAGFIGSHLADAYIARGDEVFALDDLSTGSFENVRHIWAHPRFHLCNGSVEDADSLRELVADTDVIVHLAAAVGVRLVVEQPVRTIETNVRGTEVVLAAAAEYGRKVLIASTSEVYGLSHRVPFREDDPIVLGATTTARWGYACSKALDEFLALGYCRERNVPVIVTRFFNTVGPRQAGRYGMVLPTFVRQALSGRPITVHGDGSQTRCFCDVADVVGAIIRLMEHPRAVGGVFNVGSDEEVSIAELADLVRDIVKSDSEIVYVPYEDAFSDGFEDIPRRVPDLTKIRNLIDYRTTRTLSQIVRRVVTAQRPTAMTSHDLAGV